MLTFDHFRRDGTVQLYSVFGELLRSFVLDRKVRQRNMFKTGETSSLLSLEPLAHFPNLEY